jgi:hypothetical protein
VTATRIGAIVGAALVLLPVWLSLAVMTLAASPSPAVAGGDPRSSGQGPGLVGDPAFALLVVVAIGVGSVLATLVYLRLTSQRSR